MLNSGDRRVAGLIIAMFPPQVDEFLQVEGHDNVLAIGDANNVKETKLGYLATIQAQIAARNLLDHIRRGSEAQLTPYSPFGGFEVRPPGFRV